MIPTKFLIDGIDRLGKSSLMQRINDDLGYHLTIHYDKPKVLDCYLSVARAMIEAGPSEDHPGDNKLIELSVDNLARYLYQEEANIEMFKLLQTKIPLVIDRTHLGEMVYGPMYRKYDGDYVLVKEAFMLQKCPASKTDVRLILLTTSNLDIVQDDGLSFDFAKRGEEQELFKAAFRRSNIPNKVMIDVHNGNGGYKTYVEIFEEAVGKY
jgi:hypothetical protein